MTTTIKFDVDENGVALMTIDLPGASMNVINAQFMADFEECVDKVLADDAIKGAVITSGKVGSFVAGADLTMLGGADFAKGTIEEQFEQTFRLNKLFRKMETGGKDIKVLEKEGTKPFVAAINGLALGGGFEIALACHYRVCAADPRIQIGFPEVQVGLLPGAGGTQRLPRITGIQNAAQPLMAGKNFNPFTAQGFGILQEVVPLDEVVEKAKAYVAKTSSAIAP